MGCYCGTDVTMHVNYVINISEKFGLPMPRRDDWAYQLNARECKKILEKANETEARLFKSPRTTMDVLSGDQISALFDLAIASKVIRTDMTHYINKTTNEADRLKLTGTDRKKFFRRATRKYRLIFS